MNLNFIDKTVSFFNPEAGLKRAQNRLALDAVRNRSSTSSDDAGWVNLGGQNAQSSASGSFRKLADQGRKLRSTNPLARRIVDCWSYSAVAHGIKLNFALKGEDSTDHEDKLSDAWDEWAESTMCDFEGHNNLYGLQNLWVQTMVESGGVLVLKRFDRNTPHKLKLQTLEQDYLDTSKQGDHIVDGIEYTNKGTLKGYWIKTNQHSNKSTFFPESEVVHIFKKERTGQHVGLSWLHSVAKILTNYDTYIEAKLLQQQIAACFAAIITGAKDTIGLKQGSSTDVDTISPAMIEYVPEGTTIEQLNPPKADNSKEFEVALLRLIALGSNGLTYEMFSGDYNRVTFASGRMGKNEFNSALDTLQHTVLKPKLDKIVSWFLQYSDEPRQITEKADYEWTFPARASINPKEDLEYLTNKARVGFSAPSDACKVAGGASFRKTLAKWKKDKELMDLLGIKLDLDPSHFAKTGNQILQTKEVQESDEKE